ETVLYSFCSQTGCPDGSSPVGGLLSVKGTLYGTTGYFGSGTYCGSTFDYYDCGTGFSLGPTTGAQTLIYSFCNQQNCPVGASPSGNMIYTKQILYGTMTEGGTYNAGTVFSIDLSTGTETVLHSFGQRHDGRYPAGGLVRVNGRLYGTTPSGGKTGGGTVYW